MGCKVVFRYIMTHFFSSHSLCQSKSLILGLSSSPPLRYDLNISFRQDSKKKIERKKSIFQAIFIKIRKSEVPRIEKKFQIIISEVPEK